jgi:5-methylcytosine-specific restriction enzyme A
MKSCGLLRIMLELVSMFIDGFVDKKQVAKERHKARELRQSQWWKQKLAQGICHYCEQKFSVQELTMDHVIPLSRGGRSTKGNAVVCCKECNSKKKYYTPVDLHFMDLEPR